MVSVFDFVNKFLTNDGVVLFFYLDDFCILKEIISYMESYILHVPLLIVLSFGMLQTLLNQITLLGRDFSKLNLFCVFPYIQGFIIEGGQCLE